MGGRTGGATVRSDKRVLKFRRTAAQPRPSRKNAAPMLATKKPSGQFVRYDSTMPAHTQTGASQTERARARAGLAVTDRAAAAGPIIRLNISSAPTTGTVIDVARAITTRNTSSIRSGESPRAAATSGIADVSSSGRNSTTKASTETAPRPAIGSTSAELTPKT